MTLTTLHLNALDPSDDQTTTAPDFIKLELNATGDINGDGLVDYIYDAPLENHLIGSANSHATGSTYVVFGREDGLPETLDLSVLDGTNGFVIQNDAVFISNFTSFSPGMTGSTVGDFNDDGYDDILTSFNGSTTLEANGALIYGGENGFSATIKLSTLTDEQGHLITEREPSSYNTTTTLFADMDGDGIDDIIVHNLHTGNGGGEISIIFGSSEDATGDLQTSGNLTSHIIGKIQTDPTIKDSSNTDITLNLDTSIKSIGDINGDGFDDLFASVFLEEINFPIFYYNLDESNRIIFGSNDLRTETLSINNASEHVAIISKDIEIHDNLGDINGDGFIDIAVELNSGTHRIAHLSAENTLVYADDITLSGGDIESIFSAGDINGDGIKDVLVKTMPTNADSTSTPTFHIIYGRDGLKISALEELTEDQGFSFELDSRFADSDFTLNGDLTGDSSDNLGIYVDGPDGAFFRLLSNLSPSAPQNLDTPKNLKTPEQPEQPEQLNTPETPDLRDTPNNDGLKLTGTPENDMMAGGTGDDTIDALSSNDRIIGLSGHDWIQGGAGNDTLKAGSDNDTIYGGDGTDRLKGAGGDDALYGKKGADTLKGGTGNDRMLGGAQDDLLLGMDGNDTLKGVGHDDTLDGGNGEDHLRGNKGADLLKGGLGDDTLLGGAQNDRLIGNGGNDTLNGGGHDDTLKGGNGDDVLTGGKGADMFVFADDGSTDRVTDFADGVDMLQIAGERFGDLTIRQTGDDVRIAFGDSAVLLEDQSAGSLTAADFIF